MSEDGFYVTRHVGPKASERLAGLGIPLVMASHDLDLVARPRGNDDSPPIAGEQRCVRISFSLWDDGKYAELYLRFFPVGPF